jgi:hypothetical protein
MPAPNGHAPMNGRSITARLPAPITFDSSNIVTNAAITKS